MRLVVQFSVRMEQSATTPSAPASQPAPVPTQKLLKRAIFYAIAFDVGLSLSLGFVTGYVYMAVITGGTFVYFSDLETEISQNFGFTLIYFIFGMIISTMAGYVAAQVGKCRPYTHALWAASLLVLIHLGTSFKTVTIILTKTSEVSALDVFNILSSPLVIVAYLAGAHIYQLIERNASQHETV